MLKEFLVAVVDPCKFIYDREVGWCLAEGLDARIAKIRAFYLKPGGPNWLRRVSQDRPMAGAAFTLEALRDLKGQPDRQRHLLRAALLFPYVGSSRGRHIRDTLPAWTELKEIYDTELLLAGVTEPWPFACTDVVPSLAWSDGGQLGYLEDLRDLNVFQARLEQLLNRTLDVWQPVLVTYTDDLNQDYVPELRKQLEEADAKREADDAAWRAKKAEEARLRNLALLEKRKEHPRFDEWDEICNEELKALVWQKPLRAVAKDFGISDVAVKKRCKSWGIATPPQGYWLRKVA